MSFSWKEYWEKNRERILRMRKIRYRTDPKYREEILRRAKERYERERRRRKPRIRKFPKTAVPGLMQRMPRPYLRPNGTIGLALHRIEVARRCAVSPMTLRLWEKNHVIPPPTVEGKNGRRWYSEEYADALAKLVKEYRAEGWNNLEKLALAVRKEFSRRKIR